MPPKGTSNGLLLYLSLVWFLCRIYFEVEAEWVMLATDRCRYKLTLREWTLRFLRLGGLGFGLGMVCRWLLHHGSMMGETQQYQKTQQSTTRSRHATINLLGCRVKAASTINQIRESEPNQTDERVNQQSWKQRQQSTESENRSQIEWMNVSINNQPNRSQILPIDWHHALPLQPG